MAGSNREKYHFGTFLQLESETKVRLRPLLRKYDLELVENHDNREQIEGFLAAYQENTWLDFLQAIKPLILEFIARYKEIADAGSPEEKSVLQSMVTHEESFLHWIDKEAAGQNGALELAIEQLSYPLPPC